jgi:broad specificity phosphatase PhoE
MVRTLEVRRHSIRKHGAGSQLSQAGVDLARRIGATIGPFDRVATSVSPRARETAIAMGFAVDQEFVTLAHEDALYAELEASGYARSADPFVDLAAVCARDGPTRRYAHSLAAVWRDLLTPLPDGGSVLVIGHSGEIDLGLVAAFPDADHAAWGAPFAPCEGAVLEFSGELARFTAIRMLRVETA